MEGTAIELDGQYRMLRDEAAIVRRGPPAILRVSGAEAADYLQGQLTNDVEALEPGAGCYAALLDRKGRMQSDMRVLRLDGSELLVEAEPAALPAVARHLEMYKIGREVEVSDESDGHALVSVIGPAWAQLANIPPLGAEHSHSPIERDGVGARAIRTDLGIDLLTSADDAEALAGVLLRDGLEEASGEAAEILRVEEGRPRFGAEMTTETIPQEAGINERAVSFTKGCYIGQETVARLHYKGKPNRHLRGLRLTEPATAGEPVSTVEREVGVIGTAVISPAEGPIALAVLRREAGPGSTVAVGAGGAEAEVVELPFRDPA